MMRRILLVTLAVTAAVATACSSDEPAGDENLPAASELLNDAAASMADVSSAHFALMVNGEIPGLSVKNAEGDLTREGGAGGAAEGTVSMDLMGNLFEGSFVLVDDSLYIKGPTGGYQELPASMVRSLYDPAAILDPEKGVANVMKSVTDARTEAAVEHLGESTYRVVGRVTKDVVSSLVPGIDSDVDITFWLKQDEGHLPVQATVKVPNASVDVLLSDINKQVDITAPQ